jgi:Domain of unknown function (DUF4391)
MKAEDLIASLDLPAGSRVDQRIPKKTLAENGASTAAARRQIQESIEELRWIAALKPVTVGVPEYSDSVREYLEIAVLHLEMRGAAKPLRLTELTHRAIPYPVVLFTSHADCVVFSLAHKRWSQAEKGQMVLDGDVVHVEIDSDMPEDYVAKFRSVLSLVLQPRDTMYGLYQGWLDAVFSLKAASVLGNFSLPKSPKHGAERREALAECTRLEAEMATLRVAATRETQLPRQVDLNLRLKDLQTAYSVARAQL